MSELLKSSLARSIGWIDIMALRNYLYAKHLDPLQTSLINRDPRVSIPTRTSQKTKHMKLESELTQSCPPEKQLVLDDGSKVCANCADCPKKTKNHDGNPKIKVQLDDLSAQVHDIPTETDFTTQG